MSLLPRALVCGLTLHSPPIASGYPAEAMDGYPSKVTQHTDKITVSSYVIETREYRSEAIAKVLAEALRVFSIRTLAATKQTELNKQIITHIVRERKSKFLATDFIL